MKKRRFAGAAALLAIAFLTVCALASQDVPREVLDAREGVVRVYARSSYGTVSGTGFAVGTKKPAEFIVTNHHVIEENPARIWIWQPDGKGIRAKIYADLPSSDLCVLRLIKPVSNVEPLVLYDGEDSAIGRAVYALGFPGASDLFTDVESCLPDDVTITDGIVSAARSFTLEGSSMPVRMLQINNALNFGNSGGPLLNKRGQVLGINSWGARDSNNINGAVSVDELINLLRQSDISYRASTQGEERRAALLAVFGFLLTVGLMFLLTWALIRRSQKAALKKI